MKPNRPQELTCAVGFVVVHALLGGFDGVQQVVLVRLKLRILLKELSRLDVDPFAMVEIPVEVDHHWLKPLNFLCALPTRHGWVVGVAVVSVVAAA